MRKVALILAVLAMPTMANAQAPAPPIPTTLIGNYCFYAGLVYSYGSGLCVQKTPYVCVPSGAENVATPGQVAFWLQSSVGRYSTPGCN